VGDTATALQMPLALAQSYLLLAEERGVLCRDDGPRGILFFPNFFAET
jgi:ESCRT-II complex subunit VPS36